MAKEKILIADSGSTKTAWALVAAENEAELVTTAGCNAAMAGAEECAKRLEEALHRLEVTANELSAIRYYGAGCATAEICSALKKSFASVCSNANIKIASDLEGAARALFNDESGIACILGTGSNSALYDGNKIVMNVPPLGYILGDEGSGASLGRRLVRDALRGQLNSELTEELAHDYGITKENVLQRVYRQAGGNVFLASVVPFLAKHRDNETVRHILIEEFAAFFERNVDLYPECRDYKLGFVGSIAVHFRNELEIVASSMGYFICDTIKDPISRLINQTQMQIK